MTSNYHLKWLKKHHKEVLEKLPRAKLINFVFKIGFNFGKLSEINKQIKPFLKVKEGEK